VVVFPLSLLPVLINKSNFPLSPVREAYFKSINDLLTISFSAYCKTYRPKLSLIDALPPSFK